jgi:hypothetical protein
MAGGWNLLLPAVEPYAACDYVICITLLAATPT